MSELIEFPIVLQITRESEDKDPVEIPDFELEVGTEGTLWLYVDKDALLKILEQAE